MENFEEILEQVVKPGRYLGNEWNVAKKNFADVDVKVALCFPDVYEIGMSHLGFRIIYDILNLRDDALCERAFAPWPDFSDILLKRNLPLFSLESKTPLMEFDVVAFTLTYEMNYTNILHMLELAKIPLKSDNRGPGFPLVIGGGPCALNPEPLADFFDLFVVGEGEDVVNELVDTLRKMKSEKITDKKRLLLELARIEGIYVPSLYNITYKDDGTINNFTPLKKGVPSVINRRTVRDLNKSPYPTKYLVPYINIIHDRVMVEIMRGCMHRCRFCQARVCYNPVRIRSKEKIFDLIGDAYRNTGYEEFSLMSLSSGDYPGITDLIDGLSQTCALRDRGVGVSLPSLRVEDVLLKVPQSIGRLRKTGLTFAPEAGTQRLRRVIAKEIDTEKLLEAVKAAKNEGWRRIKLYFMIGLPTEEYADIDGILDLLHRLSSSTGKGIFEIATSISPFIPKPHTPFQWEKMESSEELFEKQEYIKTHTKSKRIRLKFHNLKLSFMEGVFSRGDRNLGRVLLEAFKNGARFDSWDEFFKFDTWMHAFEKEGIDPNFYTGKREPGALLPWDHIDAGVAKERLVKEAREIHSG